MYICIKVFNRSSFLSLYFKLYENSQILDPLFKVSLSLSFTLPITYMIRTTEFKWLSVVEKEWDSLSFSIISSYTKMKFVSYYKNIIIKCISTIRLRMIDLMDVTFIPMIRIKYTYLFMMSSVDQFQLYVYTIWK